MISKYDPLVKFMHAYFNFHFMDLKLISHKAKQFILLDICIKCNEVVDKALKQILISLNFHYLFLFLKMDIKKLYK